MDGRRGGPCGTSTGCRERFARFCEPDRPASERPIRDNCWPTHSTDRRQDRPASASPTVRRSLRRTGVPASSDMPKTECFHSAPTRSATVNENGESKTERTMPAHDGTDCPSDASTTQAHRNATSVHQATSRRKLRPASDFESRRLRK